MIWGIFALISQTGKNEKIRTSIKVSGAISYTCTWFNYSQALQDRWLPDSLAKCTGLHNGMEYWSRLWSYLCPDGISIQEKNLNVHHAVPNRHLRSKHVFRPPSRSLPLLQEKHNSQLSANGNRSIPYCTYITDGWFSSCANENVLRARTLLNEETVRE